jgi:hypothetical protein
MANEMGWLGWFSLAGFVILGLLYILDIFATGLWAFSATWTLIVAIVAGIGAALLYYGNDPTAEESEVEVTETT